MTRTWCTKCYKDNNTIKELNSAKRREAYGIGATENAVWKCYFCKIFNSGYYCSQCARSRDAAGDKDKLRTCGKCAKQYKISEPKCPLCAQGGYPEGDDW